MKKGSFTAPARDRNTGLHVFAIREARPHPGGLHPDCTIRNEGGELADPVRELTGRCGLKCTVPH